MQKWFLVQKCQSTSPVHQSTDSRQLVFPAVLAFVTYIRTFTFTMHR